MNLHEATRPVLIFGAGIRGAEKEARELVELLQIPVCLTWGACDLLPESNKLRIGTFGTHGTRAANFAVQNADYILSIGCRLDTKATGTPAKWFAREAHIVMVDIDQAELDKMEKVGVRVSGVCRDAHAFMSDCIGQIKTGNGQLCAVRGEDALTMLADPKRLYYAAWRAQCQDWKQRYPAVLPEYEKEEGVNPYVLIRELSRLCEPGDIIVTDTGCAVAWTCQAWEFKEGQRLIHPWNQTPMGYALPGAIGAHYATGKRVIVVVGDGSLMMSIAELATITEKNLPIHILLLENRAHSMCVQSEQEHFCGVHAATTPETGLSFPDFFDVANAFRFRVDVFSGNANVPYYAKWLLERDAVYPHFLIAQIDRDHDVKPKTKFGKPNEDAYPYLPRETLQAEMIVGMV